jgi:hypothetical protein
VCKLFKGGLSHEIKHSFINFSIPADICRGNTVKLKQGRYDTTLPHSDQFRSIQGAAVLCG